MNTTPLLNSFKEIINSSRPHQLLALGLMTLLCLCLIIVLTVGLSFVAWGAEAPPDTASQTKHTDSFRPTPEQWAGLKIKPVTQTVFHSQQMTDGKIAINDDTTTPVFSPYSGRVVRLIAKAGDVVKQNAPLFAIEATEFIQAENDLIATAASLKTAKAQLNLATTNEKRQHDLFEAKGSALKNWQQSQVDLATAQAALRSAEIAYAQAHNHLRILGKGDADIDAIENALDAQKMDAEAVVVAPRDGTVVQRQIGLGQFIQAGASSPVYTIGDLSTVWLVANVRESDAPLVHVDAPVEVRVLAFPDRIFTAKLSYVAAMVDPVTHRLSVRAEVENTDGALKPEMFATFGIITGEDAQALAVPENAVIYEGAEAHVWVARDDKTVALKNIHVGRTKEGLVEVTDGLKPDDKIVTSGALFIDRAAAGD